MGNLFGQSSKTNWEPEDAFWERKAMEHTPDPRLDDDHWHWNPNLKRWFWVDDHPSLTTYERNI